MLKRLPILLLLLSAFCMSALAQIGERRTDFAVGGSAGYSMSKVDFVPTIKQEYKGSPTFGLTARYISEKYFTAICGVQMELNFAQMGWQEVIEDGTGNTYKRDLNYVQIPMLMQMGWGRERRGLKFVFEAGPQIGYCLGTTEHRGGLQPWDDANRPNHVTHQYGGDIDNKFDYGITGGIGLELSTSIGHFLLEGRYYYGLSDMYDNSKKGFFDRSANQAITVKLNYLIDLHRTKQ